MEDMKTPMACMAGKPLGERDFFCAKQGFFVLL